MSSLEMHSLQPERDAAFRTGGTMFPNNSSQRVLQVVAAFTTFAWLGAVSVVRRSPVFTST
jgi:hypothetical protein